MPRSYLVNAVDVLLAAPVATPDLTITVDDAAPLPTVPFYLVVDPFSQTDGREYMLCTAVNGNILTVTRNLDGTESTTHPTGDTVRITYTAQNLDDLWDGIEGANSLPSGGVQGEALRKLSSTDGDAAWQPNITFNAVAPVSPLIGDWWQDTDDNTTYAWDGSAWQNTSAAYLPLAGGTMAGTIRLDEFPLRDVYDIRAGGGNNTLRFQQSDGGNRLIIDPTTATFFDSNIARLLTLRSVDARFDVPVNMNNSSPIINVVDPTNPQDAATKNYIDTIIGGAGPFLELAGGTMAGIINMGNFRIEGVAAPNSADDAANKGYVDGQDALYLLLTGGTLTGDLTVNTVIRANTTIVVGSAGNIIWELDGFDSWFSQIGGDGRWRLYTGGNETFSLTATDGNINLTTKGYVNITQTGTQRPGIRIGSGAQAVELYYHGIRRMIVPEGTSPNTNDITWFRPDGGTESMNLHGSGVGLEMTDQDPDSSVVRNVTIASIGPSGGKDGDVWMQY